jgi:hypothetical protein
MRWGLIARVALDNKMQGSGSTKRTKGKRSGSFTSSSSGADRKDTGRKVTRSNHQHE